MSGAFQRVTSPGVGANGRIFITIKWDGRMLSISGVEGPRSNGDCQGSCGQIDMHPWDIKTYSEGWNADEVAELREIWGKWHLNDMRPGCEHQRAAWDPDEVLEVTSYKLTTAAYYRRVEVIGAAAAAQARGEALNLSTEESALILLDDWFKPRYSPPSPDSPLAGCYEVEKVERKAAGWVYPSEHPRGLLTKPCEVCGYKYGSAWLFEAVPLQVVEWLEGLPDAGTDDWGRPLRAADKGKD